MAGGASRIGAAAGGRVLRSLRLVHIQRQPLGRGHRIERRVPSRWMNVLVSDSGLLAPELAAGIGQLRNASNRLWTASPRRFASPIRTQAVGATGGGRLARELAADSRTREAPAVRLVHAGRAGPAPRRARWATSSGGMGRWGIVERGTAAGRAAYRAPCPRTKP
jgi:hypothetical protein